MTNTTPLSERERKLYLLIAEMADDCLSALRSIQQCADGADYAPLAAVWLDKLRASAAKAHAIIKGGGA